MYICASMNWEARRKKQHTNIHFVDVLGGFIDLFIHKINF